MRKPIRWATKEVIAQVRLYRRDGVSTRVIGELLSVQLRTDIGKGAVVNLCRKIGLLTARPVIAPVGDDPLFLPDLSISVKSLQRASNGFCQWPLTCNDPTTGLWCNHHAGLLKLKRAA